MAAPQGKQVEADDPPSIPQVQEEPQGPALANVAPIAGPVVQRRRDKPDENRGGYECEFIHPPPTYLQTDCSICLLVLRSPHIASCCSHNFCKECIHRVHKAGKCCPLCNEKNFSLTYNRDKDVSLQQTEVYCPHRKIGCEWRGKLEMLDTHMNVNPKLDKQLEGCAFVEVQCFNDGCGQYFQRPLIVKHQCGECPLRVFSCEHCHEYESTYHDVTINHWPVCKFYPLPCPHECRQETIERQNLEQHLNKECPLQEVECEFKYAGCEAKLSRKDMPDHLRDNVGHMTLLARQNQMLALQNQALARQNQELMAKLLEKEEQFRTTMEDNRRKTEDSIARLTEMLAHQNEEVRAAAVEITQLKDRVEEVERSTTTKAEHEKLVQPAVTKTEFNDLLQKQEAAGSGRDGSTGGGRSTGRVLPLPSGSGKKKGKPPGLGAEGESTRASKGSGGASSEKNECPICLEMTPDKYPKMTACGHKFCRECIGKSLYHSPYCPTCKRALRTVVGNQPVGGTMDCQVLYHYLPGYQHCGTIQITYTIPGGIQGPEHPNPGQPFFGTHRVAYLPHNHEGREVLKLLKRAFDARLIFTVGTSVTTGTQNTVTWNDIHHKTNIRGGQQAYGYPDPTYLQRVKLDLAAKGITMDTLVQ